jgi:hypothetical protein
MTPCAYRSLQPALRERIEALCERRLTERPDACAARRVATRRMAWAVAGGVGTAMGAVALLSGLMANASTYPVDLDARSAATCLLLGAWPAGLVAGLVGLIVARISTTTLLDAPVTMSGDPATDLACLEADDPLWNLRRLAARWEFASTALPLAALSLAAPLTIHWFVAELLGIGTLGPTPQEFGKWVGLSALIVGHAHLALLFMAVRWARSLRTCETCFLRSWASSRWARALFCAVGVAAVPGIVLLAIPPVLVGLTGLVFVPAMYAMTARRVERERLALGTT